MDFSKNILLYSNYCNYSKKFYETLSGEKNLFSTFEFISVDVNPQTKTRNPLFFEVQKTLGMKVKEVPTIVVENGQYMLSGKEAFKWLEYTMSQKRESVVQEQVPVDLQGYNTLEMGSFSDQYSRFGSNQMNDATDQIFKFLNKQDEPIPTPQEESELTSDAFERKQNERESFGNISRKPISSVNKLLPVSSTSSFSNPESKKRDLDSRYQQLLSERDSMVPKPQRVKPDQVDFQAGKVYY
jgi:hypothetical protein